jgi:5-hydroxyisourate hydrolase-like protein (transthyretin family)
MHALFTQPLLHKFTYYVRELKTQPLFHKLVCVTMPIWSLQHHYNYKIIVSNFTYSCVCFNKL